MKASQNQQDCSPNIPILDLVQNLCSSQLSIQDNQQLIDFLHRHIFPGFSPCTAEIYIQQMGAPGLYSRSTPAQSAQKLTGLPQSIDTNAVAPENLKGSNALITIDQETVGASIFDKTGNLRHLLVPVPGKKAPLALLYIGAPQTAQFNDSSLKGIKLLASIVSGKMMSMDTISRLQQTIADVEYAEQLRKALHEISQRAQNSSNIEKLYKKLHTIVAKVIHAPNFYVALITDEEDGKYVNFPYYADERDPHFQGHREKYDEQQLNLTTCLHQFRNVLLLTPKNFDAICTAHDIKVRGTRPRSWLGAPFYLDELAGVVAVQSYGEIVYSEKDKELIAFVARQIAAAIHRNLSMEELKEAKIKAENAEKNKSTFLANMSHEIRTPMNGIIGLTDLVLQSDIDSQHRTYLEMVSTSAHRLLKLINDILDFSKIDAGKLELDVAPFNLRDVLANSLEILAISAAKKDIELKVFCDSNLPDGLIGDGYKLGQILINLLSNGIKFTENGSVSVHVEKGNSPVASSTHASICFTVQDTGIGIPEDEVEKVFQAFNQLSTTRDSNHRGTGLGLVIASQLVEIMGGRIEVQSREGIGTSFRFTLNFPVHDGGEATMVSQNPHCRTNAKGVRGNPLNILLVEDEIINRTLALAVLEREGWKVAVAQNGIEAVQMHRKENFDLILMDIQMPRQNGYDTTQIIREYEAKQGGHVPIIAMTAYAVKGDREKCLRAGMDGYVSKPIQTDTLYFEIKKVLEKRPGVESEHAA